MRDDFENIGVDIAGTDSENFDTAEMHGIENVAEGVGTEACRSTENFDDAEMYETDFAAEWVKG